MIVVLLGLVGCHHPDARVEGGHCRDTSGADVVKVEGELFWASEEEVEGDVTLVGALRYTGEATPGVYGVWVHGQAASVNGGLQFVVTFPAEELRTMRNAPEGLLIETIDVQDACGRREVTCGTEPCALVRFAEDTDGGDTGRGDTDPSGDTDAQDTDPA